MEVREFNTRSIDKTTIDYYRLSLIEMNELDVPSDLCYTGLDSNFNECVKRKVAQKVFLKIDSLVLKFLGNRDKS